MHIGSTVTGIIRNDKDAVDAVDAILPAGTLSGAGIVADSVPKKEFQECVNKAKAVVQAIEKAQEGLE